MSRAILSIGAGVEQLESIKIAEELGFKVIAVDGDTEAVGFGYASVSHCVDIKDENVVIQVARDYGVDFVLPAPIGNLLTVVGAVNDAIGLRGISNAAARACTNKATCNNLLKDAGVPVAQQWRVSGAAELYEVLEKATLPVIVKPNKGSGSRGVRLISTMADLPDIEDGDWLIETFIEGREFGVDAVLFSDVFECALIRDKDITTPPYRQELGYTVPTSVDENTRSKILETVEKAARVLKFSDCLINADVIVTAEGDVYLLEIAGRASGNLISTQMVPAACSRDYLKEAILLMAKGGKPRPFEIVRPITLKFIDCSEGTVLKCKKLPTSDTEAGMLAGVCSLQPGNILNAISSTADVFMRGWVMTTGATTGEARELASNIIQKMEIEVV